jgi:hypothetical protein
MKKAKIMKKQTLTPLILLLMLVLFSCKKESQFFDYKIDGIVNLSTNRGETKTIDVAVKATEGTPEKVTLALKDVPDGITAAIETRQGLPNFTTPISFIISQNTVMGEYDITLEATSASTVKTVVFKISVTDQLSMIFAVYDATQNTPDLTVGEVASGAVVKLFLDAAAFSAKTSAFTAKADSAGRALFYHVPAGNYLFTVEKDNLSNIVEKTSMGGFVTTGIFQNQSEILNSAQPTAQIGQIRYRDQNFDDKITDADRRLYDMVMHYDGIVTNKIIWIGK